MVAARRGLWFSLLVCALMFLKAQGFSVPITYVENGVVEGAVCLDCSPPTYHFDKGFGAGINNWLVFVEAILSGCSAGGFASILYCDNFRALFPVGTRVKCLADAGFFINVKDISDASHIEEFFAQVVATHGSIKHLPASCTKRLNPAGLCFFPQYVAGQVITPLFIINSAYDRWQISHILVPDDADPNSSWESCKNMLTLSAANFARESDGVYLGYRWSRRVYDSREDFDKFKDKIIVKINDTSFYRSNEENKAWEEIPSDY
ncbi:Pectin acetylesterase 8 [Citrus sinensis]|nr:Pectin acetylesterase 8 [Citrus sinensis]